MLNTDWLLMIWCMSILLTSIEAMNIGELAEKTSFESTKAFGGAIVNNNNYNNEEVRTLSKPLYRVLFMK